MGSLCAVESERSDNPTIKLINHNFKGPQILFILQDSPQLHAQSLILNTKQAFNLQMINRTMGTQWGKLIRQTINSDLKTDQLKVGQVVAIKNPIRDIDVKSIIVAVMPVWKNSKANKIVRECFEKCMEALQKLNQRVIIIAELAEELGIPNNVACKIIANSISENKDKLDRVSLLFRSKQVREFYISYFETFRGGQTILSSIPNDY